MMCKTTLEPQCDYWQFKPETNAGYDSTQWNLVQSSKLFPEIIQLNRHIENFVKTHPVRCKTPSILACITRNPLPVACWKATQEKIKIPHQKDFKKSFMPVIAAMQGQRYQINN